MATWRWRIRWLAMADAATGDGGSEAARGGGRWRWAAMVVGGEALGDGRRGGWRWNSAVAARSLGPGRAGSGLLRAPTKWGGAGADMARCGWSSGAVELRWRAPVGGSEVAGEMDTNRNGSSCSRSTMEGGGRTNSIQRAFSLTAERGSPVVFEPAMGMVFSSEQEAHEFYNAYSWEVGFGIKRGNKYTTKPACYKTMQEFLCSCEGSNKEENTKSARTKCKAMVRLKRTADDGWYFSTVVLTHNHELADTAGEKKVWKCHNTIDSSIKELIKHMRSNNIPVNKVYGVMSDIHGRHEEVPFSKRCLKNLCATLAHDSSLNDITKTLDIFSKMQAQNPDYFYAVKVD
ncbi:protein FAR1-RELATED SEQUENCE 12-like [Triticum aestivum]|uniref:protein FAR1-RELATED SEQUENCE 12-like n=1 Tax=Triticum aestivum TaxID=4565 RepID=UPI001D0337B2|nr:protein FAR1-RELATED SEQUENCE 12-like [Triticum aestivum]